MLNIGGGEVLVIMLVALLVLGPQKLPEAARQVAAMARELRKVSSGFQAEMRAALDEPVEQEARERGRTVVSTEQAPSPDLDGDDATDDTDDTDGATDDTDGATDDTEGDDESGPIDAQGRPISTAAAAGMYDVASTPSDDTGAPTGDITTGSETNGTETDDAEAPHDATDET